MKVKSFFKRYSAMDRNPLWSCIMPFSLAYAIVPQNKIYMVVACITLVLILGQWLLMTFNVYNVHVFPKWVGYVNFVAFSAAIVIPWIALSQKRVNPSDFAQYMFISGITLLIILVFSIGIGKRQQTTHKPSKSGFSKC